MILSITTAPPIYINRWSGLLIPEGVISGQSHFGSFSFSGRKVTHSIKNVPKELNPLYKNVFNNIPSSLDNCAKQNVIYDKIIMVDSYEWVRYASLPGVRVVGGMGRLLKEFERRVCREAENITGRPYEIMSYADLEFSGGDTYKKLGFLECGIRQPVEFAVIADTYERVPLLRLGQKKEGAILYTFYNLGSLKYIKPYNL